MTIRFLIDENVNQCAIRSVPLEGKEFEIIYPLAGGFCGTDDRTVRRLAVDRDAVLVTTEKDFGGFGLQPADIPAGVIWIRPSRTGQRKVIQTLARFCRFLQRQFPSHPYDFQSKIIAVYEDRAVIRSTSGATSYPLP